MIADLFSLWRPSGVPSTGNFGLRLAIRNGYLNLYQFGQSMARLSFDRRCQPVVSLHPKYVLCRSKGEPAGDLSSAYVRISGDAISGRQSGLPERYAGHEMLTKWITTARSYAGDEKKFVDRLVGANSNVIDLEMALPALPGKRSAPRMDIVALEESDGKTRIVFWEAKCMDNSELRARAEPGPGSGAKIFEQLATYEGWVSDPQRSLSVQQAYVSTAKALVELHGIAQSLHDVELPFSDLLRKTAAEDGAPELQSRPRLVIEDGPKNGSFAPHLERLTDQGYVVRIVDAGEIRPVLGVHD